MRMASREGIVGDADPLDICVLAEKSITHGDVLLPAVPIGGMRMIDGNEADDKIIAVMRGDAIYGQMTDIHECPPPMITRLKHYFLTYKQDPGARTRNTEVTHVYGREEALEVIERSQADYLELYSDLAATLSELES
jgi:inorganic pyrophosphatase